MQKMLMYNVAFPLFHLTHRQARSMLVLPLTQTSLLPGVFSNSHFNNFLCLLPGWVNGHMTQAVTACA